MMFRLGTRGSPLALVQAALVRDALCATHGRAADEVEIVVIRTTGDRVQDRALADIGGKALWTRELDRALLAGEIDAAVHSMKDVETVRPAAIAIAATLPRADVRDRLIGAASIDQGLLARTGALARQWYIWVVGALVLFGTLTLLVNFRQMRLNNLAGAPPFWTLGANQSGKAAISAWRDLLLPALAGSAPPGLWPFDGALLHLLAPGRTAVAEAYPAEALRQLGLRLPGSKRRQSDRSALAPALRATMAGLDAAPDPALDAWLAAGFGPDAAGEDRLDCVLGVLGMVQVLAGRRTDAAPADPWVQRWEGWVLGQTALPLG